MQSVDWITLIDRIPADKHNSLCFLTMSGLHINVQTIIRKEPDFLVLRGRIGGSTEAGFTFMIPYAQMVCVYVQRVVSEADVVTWFTEGHAEGETTTAAAVRVAAETGAGAPGAGPRPGAAVPAGGAGLTTSAIQTRSGSIPLPGKAAILERLRKRTANSAPGTMPKPTLGSDSASGTTPKPPPAT